MREISFLCSGRTRWKHGPGLVSLTRLDMVGRAEQDGMGGGAGELLPSLYSIIWKQ